MRASPGEPRQQIGAHLIRGEISSCIRCTGTAPNASAPAGGTAIKHYLANIRRLLLGLATAAVAPRLQWALMTCEKRIFYEFEPHACTGGTSHSARHIRRSSPAAPFANFTRQPLGQSHPSQIAIIYR